MADKSALGKGLNALLPSEEEGQQGGEEGEGAASEKQIHQFDDGTRLLGRVAQVAVERIRPNPYQPRQEFNDEALDELAASIEELGVIQPITVRALGDGQFEIISGERRLRAARRAGIDRLPAFIRKASSEEMLEMALVENVQREELNPIEVALGYQRLMEECGLTQEEVSEKVSKSRATVSNFLRLLRLLGLLDGQGLLRWVVHFRLRGRIGRAGIAENGTQTSRKPGAGETRQAGRGGQLTRLNQGSGQAPGFYARRGRSAASFRMRPTTVPTTCARTHVPAS